jgi:hypothetical protein
MAQPASLLRLIGSESLIAAEPVAIAAETAAQAITPVETNATKRPHIAISETRSGYRKYALGKYYMRVGDARPHHAHRSGLRAYQNADWRYGSWD